MFKKIIAVGFILVLYVSCSSSKKGIAPNSEATQQEEPTKPKAPISGLVEDPAGQPMPGVTVRSEPPSESVITNTVGEFSISQGLSPQKYRFVAIDQNGNEGSVSALFEFGNPLRIKIIVGDDIDTTTEEYTKNREILKKTGRDPLLDPGN